ncbi:WD40 repeat domain-containing protein [Enhygromyxa salina]|uniref:WD domain, G-beta repeat n=1 Tax=Enhygromyxa salina TaxID=215803 RepID=A0A2S9YUP7_9BACT|nr:hypothetical protein [Enhygromyxa salina]PRQ08835.1 hypothetical protein ENSA7_14670 [Enhygromyxa salina]
MRASRRVLGSAWLVSLSTCTATSLSSAGLTSTPEGAAAAAPRPTGFGYRLTRSIDNDLGFLVALDTEHQRAFTGSDRGVLRYWNLDTGALLAEHPDRGSGYDAYISEDEGLVALDYDDHISVWRTADGSLLAEWEFPTEDTALSPDGRWLASCSPEGEVSLWESTTGELVNAWATTPGRRLTFGKSRNRLLGRSENDEGEAILWSVPEGREIARLAGARYLDRHYVRGQGPDCQVWRSEDGQSWLSASGVCRGISDDGTMLLTRTDSGWQRWSLAGRKLESTVQIDGYALTAADSPDASLLAVSLDEATQVWDTVSGQRLFQLPYASELRFWNGGRELLLRPVGGALTRVDLTTGRTIQMLPEGDLLGIHEDSIYTMSDSLTRWSAGDGQLQVRTAERLRVHSAELDASGRRIVGALGDGVQIWDAQTGERERRCEGLSDVHLVRWLPGDQVLVAEQSHTFVVDLTTCEPGPPIETTNGDFSPLYWDIAPQPGGAAFALPGAGGIWVFDGRRPEPMSVAPYGRAVDWAAGGMLAIADMDIIRVLTTTGELVGELGRGPLPRDESIQLGNDPGPTGIPWSGIWDDIALHPNGWLAVADESALVVFDVATGERRSETELELTNNQSARVSFDPTGRWLMVAIYTLATPHTLQVRAASDMSLVWSIGADPASTEVEASGRFFGFAWHPRGASLVVTRDSEDGAQVLAVEPKTWRVVELELRGRSYRLGEPRLSADGRRLLVPDGDDRLLIFDE